MSVCPYLFLLMMIQTFGEGEGYFFWRVNGKITSMEGTRTGLPKVSISDENSIRLQVYGRQRQKIFWCSQVVSIEQRRGQIYEELDAVTMSCSNAHTLLNGLTKNYINFGNTLFLEVKGGRVIAMFVLPSGLCTQNTYSNTDNGVEKTTQKINPTDCKKMLNLASSKPLPKTNYNTLLLITPEDSAGPETVGPTYIPTKVVPPFPIFPIYEDTTTRAIVTKPLVLYCMPGGPPGRSVNLVIHTLGLPVELHTINLLQNEQFSPEYLELNPLHTVPAIDDNGFILWESRAIMTYLVSKYGKDDSLYPKDLQKRAIVDQRLHYSNDVFYVLKQILIRLVFLKEKKISDEMLGKVRDHQENVEKLLTGYKFMAGDSLTVADFSFITIMDVLEVYSPTEDKYPLTKAWFERCKSSMKDYDKVNKAGAELIVGKLKEAMAN